MTLRGSSPTRKRKLLAAGLFAFGAAAGSLIRLSRADFGLLPILAPLDFHGTSPNFFVCFAGPFIAFFLNDVIDLFYVIKTALGTAFGLSLYEVAQNYLPSRTFDLNDILASFLGALCFIMVASILFLLPIGKSKNIKQDDLP